MIFVDGTDPDSQRRFTIAHEVAHFLYRLPASRQSAIEKYGEQITGVMDGQRHPTVSERVVAVLASQQSRSIPT